MDGRVWVCLYWGRLQYRISWRFWSKCCGVFMWTVHFKKKKPNSQNAANPVCVCVLQQCSVSLSESFCVNLLMWSYFGAAGFYLYDGAETSKSKVLKVLYHSNMDLDVIIYRNVCYTCTRVVQWGGLVYTYC